MVVTFIPTAFLLIFNIFSKYDFIGSTRNFTCCFYSRDVDVVITTGGTGITGRDLTPEVFNEILEKEIPGFGELFRWLSYKKIATSTIQSRAMGGVTKGTYLLSLPGSVGACKDAWDDILVHQLDYRHRPCNLVELMPRLREHEQDQ